MEKRKKKALVIGGGVAFGLVLICLILGLVSIRPMSYLPSDYQYVTVYNLGGGERGSTAEFDERVSAGLNKTKYSVLHAMLEWNMRFKPRFEKDADGKYVEISAKEIETVRAASDEYRVDFVYAAGNEKVIKVGKDEVRFDRVIMFIGDSKGEVVTVRVIAYLDQAIGNAAEGEEGSEEYSVRELRLNMNTNKLFLELNAAFN